MGEEPPELVRDEAKDARGRVVGFRLGWGWWSVYTRGCVSALEK